MAQYRVLRVSWLTKLEGVEKTAFTPQSGGGGSYKQTPQPIDKSPIRWRVGKRLPSDPKVG